MASIENEDYQIPPGARRTRLREGWSVRQAKMIGADVLKLLWFFRPDSDTADHQRDVVRSLVDQCADLSLPLVVEPIWYPLPGEERGSAAWQRRRVDGIIELAAEAAALGSDMLKVEFPGAVGSKEEIGGAGGVPAPQLPGSGPALGDPLRRRGLRRIPRAGADRK